jgi:hypothetical protein
MKKRSKKKIVGQFSEDLIGRYLATRVYEKRGFTRVQYIEMCRRAWNTVRYDPIYERKVIIDFSQPVTPAQLFGINGAEVDFFDSAIAELPIRGFEDKTDIECLVLRASPAPGPPKATGRVKIEDTYRPSHMDAEPETLEERVYVVGLFDVLGFSALVAEKGAAALLGTYQDLIEKAVSNTNYSGFGRIRTGKNSYGLGGFYAPVSYSYFSDTILLWTIAKFTHLSPFLAKCADLICEALVIGMPLRGSVCLGKAIMNKTTNTYVGDALVEANEIEKNQRWIGATLGSGFKLNGVKDAISEGLIVPLFCQHHKETMKLSFPYLTLDWVSRWNARQNADLLTTLQNLRDRAPEKNKAYYDNTIDFTKYTFLDDSKARAAFLRARGYHVKDLQKVRLNALTPQHPVVMKVKGDILCCGHILSLPPEVLASSPVLADLFATNVVFVNRLDYGTFVASLPDKPGVDFDLVASGVVRMVAKTNVEFIDVFNCDPADELPEDSSGIVVIE